jgi:hypothetical protein
VRTDMLRVALNCRPVLTLCADDVLPVIEDLPKTTVCTRMLWIALDCHPALMLCTSAVLPVM